MKSNSGSVIFKYCCWSILLAITIASCNKANNKPYRSLAADVKKYYDYKQGSYWIYRDSISGAIDSMFLSSRYYQAVAGGNDFDYEYIANSMTLVNVSPSPLDTFGIGLSFIGDEEVDAGYVNGVTMYRNVFSPLFTLPLMTEYIGPNSTSISMHPNFALGSVTYSDVAEIHSKGDYQNVDNWFYINNEVGFIKMRLHHTNENYDRVFELIRYHIVI